MIKQGKPLFILVLLPFYFLTCGIDKFYYLPQVSQGNIKMEMNTSADIILPNLSNNSEYNSYNPGYSIFYRIYISENLINAEIQQSDMSTISSTLSSDFSAFFTLTDPTNYSSLTNATTFRNRFYHELELDGAVISDVLTGNGGAFKINFPPIPGERPEIIDTGKADFSRHLFRNSGNGMKNGIIFDPEPDRYFLYSPELVEKTDYPIVTGGRNNDVVLRNNSKEDRYTGYAYVSMYIVAVGSAPDFSRIFSKPTHIGVFILQAVN